MDSLIKCDAVWKSFHNGQEDVNALKDVSFSIKKQDYLAIIGPSGAGKSTLLHIMGGLDIPTKGKVFFQERDIYVMKDNERASWRNNTLGFVFQFYHLIEELNVLENIAIASRVHLRKSAFKIAQTLLEYLDIEGRQSFFPSQLSGGERQKVALARALINDPEIVLCDEPTGNLDKDSQDKVVELLEKLNADKQKTIILVTHNPELAKRARRIITLKSGEIAA